jgi:hypothetical protein
VGLHLTRAICINTSPPFAVLHGESIASEGKGYYLLVKVAYLMYMGAPRPNVTIETWKTDVHKLNDIQYTMCDAPGRLKSDAEG